MAVYAYCRASTAKQIASPEVQKGIIRKYCHQKGLDFYDLWFVDPATSGKHPIGERPAGRQLLAHIKRGDHVVVARLDRLSRSFINFGRILETFENLGVTLHICDIPGGELDPSNHIGRIMVYMLCAFADYERRLISVRVQEGIANMRDHGHVFGTPPYGYRKVYRMNRRLGKKIGILEPDPAEQKVVQKLLELRAKGWAYDRIAQWLNKEAMVLTRAGYQWDHSTVRKAIRTGLKQMAAQEWSDTQAAVEEAIKSVTATADEIPDVKPCILDEDPEEGEEEVIAE